MFGLYIHWPFCLSKCPYCDFNSHVRENLDEDPWLNGILHEIKSYAEIMPEPKIDTIFFGGGTPSLASPIALNKILNEVQKHWQFADDIEITLEANPHTVEAQKFKDFRSIGINRVSIGVQSLRDKDLKFLGRKHDVKEAKEAIKIAQEYFERLSFDLIYARPDQTLNEWQEELKEALAFGLNHYSLYQLTLEKGTAFYQAANRGDFKLPEEELARDFYLLTQDIMTAAGLPAYEVSNHAALGQESRHNRLYWQYGRFLGLGPGAHSRIVLDDQRYAVYNVKSPELWAEKVAKTNFGQKEKISLPLQDQTLEFFLMGLRLNQGVKHQDFKDIFGMDWYKSLHMEQVKDLESQGFLTYDDNHLRLTLDGMLCLNKIADLIIA
ncbi:MAG: radical SAM family heme chaperone HemW [Alphaproteobacteria bacterium]|nr:radical SAM family heme chaperone HemW [Alphaproteobacteria bacterium]